MYGRTRSTKLKTGLSKALVALIAILVLNCSVDTAFDPVPLKWNGEEYTEDLSFNDIESVYELVTECMLGMDDDFVPEQEDNDGFELGKTVKDWTCEAPVILILPPNRLFQTYPETNDDRCLQVFAEIDLPPPDKLA